MSLAGSKDRTVQRKAKPSYVSDKIMSGRWTCLTTKCFKRNSENWQKLKTDNIQTRKTCWKMSNSTCNQQADFAELLKPRQMETIGDKLLREMLAQIQSNGNSCTVVGEVNLYSHIKNNREVPKNLTDRATAWFKEYTTNTEYWKGRLHFCIYSAATHNTQEMLMGLERWWLSS